MEYSAALRTAVRHYSGQERYFDQDYLLSDDVFLASYPRSGSHLVRFIIASAFSLVREGVLPQSLAAVAAVADLHNAPPHMKIRMPMVIKTHFPSDPRYLRVIHILRDPRDVAGSYFHYTYGEDWHYFIRPGAQPDFDQFLGHFNTGNIWPCSWEVHTRSFLEAASHICRHTVVYERLIEDPMEEIHALLRFLGIHLDSIALQSLVDHISFENMNRLYDSDEVRRVTGFDKRGKILRTGRVGGHSSLYDDSALARMESVYRLYVEAAGLKQERSDTFKDLGPFSAPG